MLLFESVFLELAWTCPEAVLALVQAVLLARDYHPADTPMMA